jgi:desulfoferrodoxin (superoxide reductase-like protein)
MKIFECKVCGHLEFNEAPEKCLVCKSPKSSFVENAAALKNPANPAALTDPEKKHLPQIVVVKECGLIPGVGCTDVHARVGAIEHVMQAAHFIVSLDFYLNHKFISRVWLSPEVCHPAAALHLNAQSGTVQVIENCNLHGNWMAEAVI